MSFDLRPRLPENPAESQQAEGGLNANDDCVPAAHLICMTGLGYGDPFEPEDVTSFEYGSGYIGVEDFSNSVDFLRQHPQQYPNLPAITIENPAAADLPAYLNSYGSQGFPNVVAFACDGNAQILVGGPYGHASLVVAFNGSSWTIWNVWTGYEQYFTTAQLQAAYIGGVTIFHRSVFPPLPPPPPAPQEDALPKETFAFNRRVDPSAERLPLDLGSFNTSRDEIILILRDSGSTANVRASFTLVTDAGAPFGVGQPPIPGGPTVNLTVGSGDQAGATKKYRLPGPSAGAPGAQGYVGTVVLSGLSAAADIRMQLGPVS